MRAATVGPRALSFAQERMWRLYQLEPTSAFYNCPMRVLLAGVLDVEALRRSISEIVRRHQVLRARIVEVDGSPAQQVMDADSHLRMIDLTAWGSVERTAELERLADEEMQRPFDLSQGPLLRTTLLQLSQEEHVLLITMHHVVTDWWSFGIFLQELTLLYPAFATGHASPLPQPPVEYADFAQWQRDWLQGRLLEEQLTYWKRQLAGMPVCQLATDRPRPSVQTFRGAEQPLALNKGLSDGLKTLGQQEGATYFMVLLAAFQALLHRLTGQKDIGVASAIANRNRSETQGLIGLFVNTLVMRTSLTGDPTFRELIRRVRETAIEAYTHQDLPFEKLVEALRPERTASTNPLAPLMFVLQNAPAPAAHLPGLRLLPWTANTTRFDLEAHLWETENATEGRLIYSTDLFDAQTMARMAAHYERLLEAVVADPDQRVSQLRMIGE
ncbi:MAG TPA: condensation domain-containing protein, partial [Candidatus Acidoferrales bacterium]|nr:condensation domain-containing protein [Candidatus Acidoferrales bacterium]